MNLSRTRLLVSPMDYDFPDGVRNSKVKLPPRLVVITGMGAALRLMRPGCTSIDDTV